MCRPTRWNRNRLDLRDTLGILGPEWLEPRYLLTQIQLGDLLLQGTFTQSGTTETSTTGVQIGLAPIGAESFTALTTWNGTLSFTDGGTSFDFSGTIDGIESSSTVAVAQIGSTQTFNVAQLGSATGVSLAGAGIGVGVNGGILTPNLLALLSPSGTTTTGSYVSLQGSLGFTATPGLTAPVNGLNSVTILPTQAAPGITLAASATSSEFTAFGAVFGPNTLTVGYSQSLNEFQVSGSVSVATSSGDFSATGTLGTATAPGLLIDSTGTVTALNITVDSSMNVAGLGVTAAGVALDYLPGSSSGSSSGTFEIATGTVTVGDTTSPVYFTGTFGEPATATAAAIPGLVMTGSALTSLDITVSSSMTIAGLGVTASGVQFLYSAGVFEIATGTVTVGTSGSAFYFQGTFGTTATATAAAVPGLRMTGNTLDGVDITISSSMSVSGMNLSVSNLQFIYESSNSTAFGGAYNGDFVIGIGGSVTIATVAGDTSFAATFGSTVSNLPGLVLKNGVLQSLYATVSSTINAQGLTLSVSSLQFQYVATGNYFEIGSGSVSITSGAIQFGSATFVTVNGAPGLEISNGVLQALNIKINSSLTVSGMTLAITNMQFDYASVSGQTYGNFSIAAGGTVGLSAGTASPLSFSGTFGQGTGATALPGLVINNGVLQSFYITVSSSMSLGGLTLATTGLVFTYVASSNTFEIPSGTVLVTDSNKDFSFTGTFGTTTIAGGVSTTNPGLVVAGGSLSELNITVSTNFVASGVTFNVMNLNFVYNATGNQYEIDTGSIAFSTSEGFTFSASFGLPSPTNSSVMLPGLIIVNGTLTALNASLTGSFTVAGLQIGVTDVAMSYSAGEYAMFGTVSVSTSNVSFTGTIGDPTTSTYGLIIRNNVLQSLAISINSTVNFSSLAMTATDLSFNYAAATGSSPALFSLYGSVSVAVAGVNLTGNLGTAALPGLTVVNGALTELNLGVSANFTLFGLTCDINDLTFFYQAGSTPEYVLYGSLSVLVGGNTIAANLGTQADPGLIVQGSTVTQINMAISGSFKVDGFGFAIQDAGITYTTGNGSTSYSIFGTFTLTDVFTATVQLGTGSSNPGITITNGVFVVDAITFNLDNVPIGAFTLNYLTISYQASNDEWYGAAQVTFPTGFALGASITFVSGQLEEIGVSYSAGTSTGIAVGDTGMFITEMSAELQNLNQPANIIASGTIEAVFGKKISIAGTTCSLFAATGSFSADSQQLVISGSYYEGAYQTNGQWNGILGTGTATVDLNWAAGVYSADISMSFYDGTFVISAEIAFDNSGDLGIIATASVNIPNGVPFIGGTRLGSMGFAFIYTASSGVGTVAAWASVNLGFVSVTSGFQYTFDSKSSQDGGLQIIGASQVSSLNSKVNNIASASSSVPPIYTYAYTVTIPSTATGEYGLSVQATWPSNSGAQQLLISGPNDTNATGGLNYYSATATSLSSTSVPSTDYYSFQTVNGTSQSVMVVGSATTSGGTTTASTTVPLAPGTYTFEVESSYQFSSGSDISWSQQIYYSAPTVAITSVPTKALSFVPAMTGFAASQLAANTTITLYADSNPSGYQGKSAGSFAYSATAAGVLNNVPTIDLSSFSPGVPIYIYAVINDGTNSAVYSKYSTAVIPEPDIVGQVIDQFGNPISGVTVFLDINGNGLYDAPGGYSGGTTNTGEPSAITGVNGAYYFSGLEAYSGSDLGYPNFKVDVQMPSPSFTPISPLAAASNNPSYPVIASNTVTISTTASASNPTSSQVANFSVNRLASISGSTFRDLPRTGLYLATDPALGGATVYLDSSGSGTYQAGDSTVVTGPTGLFSFYGLSVPDVGNNGFEMPALAVSSSLAQPTGTGADWTFSLGAGVASNGSSLTAGNGNAPQASQVAYLQGAASISQVISGFQAGTSYYLTVQAAAETGLAGSTFTVSYNGVGIGTFSPATSYTTFTTASFIPGAGSITLTLSGVSSSDASQTTLLDNIQILPVTTYTVGIVNATTVGNSVINGSNQYVVTTPASGTFLVPVASDAPQLTGYQFGVISLASVTGTVSATSITGTSAVQTGTTINLSTPNTSITVPSYSNFSSTSGLVNNGSVNNTGGALNLFSATLYNSKTASWYSSALPVTAGFTSTFQYTMAAPSAASLTGAGFAFVLQNQTTTTRGNTYFGYGGMASSLALVFDATNNELMLEADGNSTTTSPLAALTSSELGFTLASGHTYTVCVTYTPTATAGAGTLNVYFSSDPTGGSTPILSAVVNLGMLLNLGTSTSAYVGFTAGTASGTSTAPANLAVAINSWTFSALNTSSVVTDASGNYNFTGLMPGTAYTVNQVVPTGQVQSSPLSALGIYSQVSLASLSKSAASVTTGDFNGDGNPDVAYALSLSNGIPYAIAYAYGNGTGGFSTPTLVTMPVPTTGAPKLATPSTFSAFDAHIVAGHFVTTTGGVTTSNRDDIAYIATMANGGNVVIIYDIYTATVINAIEVNNTVVDPAGGSAATQGSFSTINNVVVGDLGNIGFDNIVTSTYGGVWTLSLANLAPSTAWLVNPVGTAAPISTPSLTAAGASGYNAGVVIADFNSDGNPDLATVGVQYQPGTAFLSGSYQSTWTTFTVLSTYEIYYGNGSGVTYTTSGSYSTSTGEVSSTTTQQTFQQFSVSSTYLTTGVAAPLYPLPISLAAADISGDGIPDLEISAYNASLQPNIFLLMQTTPDTFAFSAQVSIPNSRSFDVYSSPGPGGTTILPTSYFPAQLTAVDLNADGLPDLAELDPNVGQLTLLITNAAPLVAAYTQNTLALTAGDIGQFAVADFAMNGYPDLVIPAASSLAPNEVLNGTINVSYFSYNPTDGQALTSENFSNFAFSSTGAGGSGGTVTPALVTTTAPGGVQPMAVTSVSAPFVDANVILTGRVFQDQNFNQQYDSAELPLNGIQVYLDLNGNGTSDPGVDPTALTNANGMYSFNHLNVGQLYTIRVVSPAGTMPAQPQELVPSFHASTTLVERSFGLNPVWITTQTVFQVDPQVESSIRLASATALPPGCLPRFALVGSVPAGMSINVRTGVITWVAPASLEGKTVSIDVKITNVASRSALAMIPVTLQLEVNRVSPKTAYVRSVYGALLGRLPSTTELAAGVSSLARSPNGSQLVSSVAKSSESLERISTNIYLRVFSRGPTPTELAASVAALKHGGNSDQLMLSLLTGRLFSGQYPHNSDYVAAVNRILIPDGVSALTAHKEVLMLGLGQSRLKLVRSIMLSQAACQQNVNQQTNLLLGQPASLANSASLVRSMMTGTLNSDQVATRLLLSNTFHSNSQTKSVINLPSSLPGVSQTYNRLNQLTYTLTGADASRTQLDALQAKATAGHGQNSVSKTVYSSQAAQTQRIQAEYQNLLQRKATPAELTQLQKLLPADNQSEATQIHILASSEYQARFATTASYVKSVYLVLTGKAASASTQALAIRQLNAATTVAHFLQSVAHSRGGQIGQIDHRYAGILLRDPTQLELQSQLKSAQAHALSDEAITLKLLSTPEFRARQRTARLL